VQRVVTASIFIVLIVGLIFYGQHWPWLLWIVAGLVAELAVYEYCGLANKTGGDLPAWLPMGATALFFGISYLYPFPEQQLLLLTLLAFIGFGIALFRSPLERVLPSAAFCFFGLIYIAFPLTLLPLFGDRQDGAVLLLFLLVTVWAGDIAALYIGQRFGRFRLAPRISPNKTWEGSVGSMAGSVACGYGVVYATQMLHLYAMTTPSFSEPLWHWAVLAAIINVAAQLGDLLESAIKRGAGVKDSGKILPGHGGMLDRIDALLLAAPALWYALLIRDYFIPGR
jgi:phosphatidate cytidylyltransferase